MLNIDGVDNASIHLFLRDDDGRKFCNAWVATAIVGAGVIGAASTAYAANKAASAQESAAQTSANVQEDIFNKTQANLQPFVSEGGTATNLLNAQLPQLTSPIVMDQSTLEKTPGYQFNLTQGLKATQNSAAARGLGVSGAALKGAATFATGLADSTYQNQFANAVTNQTNAYNRLKGLVDTGESAAAGQGVIGATTGANIGNAVVGGGNAAAAADNATGAAVNNLTNNIGGYFAYKGLYGGNNSPANAYSGYNVTGLPTGMTGP
jgi:hypothetical protein